jgi:alkylation response protein AidB-like acyl-CoA dehydrogenase
MATSHTKIEGGMFLVADMDFHGVFTPEDYTSQQKDIARAAEEFITGEIMSRGDDIEILDNQLSRDLMRKSGELGFLGLDIPEKYEGAELDKISSALVAEKYGYGAGSFAVTELNHTGIGTFPLALFGTEDQLKRYLPGLSSGTLIGAFALTEPEAGSDALNSLTTATLSDDGKYYLLNGNKQFITNAGFADVVFTYAKVDGEFFTAFIVEQGWDGVSVDEEEEKMGMHGTSTRAYHFDNVRVPVKNVLGEVGKGHLVALNALNMGRYKLGASCVGGAKRAFFEAVKYAKQRVQFGRPICEFGLIKEKIANMAIRLFAAESMVYRIAGLIEDRLQGVDRGSAHAGIATAEALEEYLIECSINKIYGSETEDYLIDEEVQIHGGYGYIHGNHPELAYRNSRINRIWEGTNEINRIVIANTLIRRLTASGFDLKEAFQRAAEQIESSKPAGSGEPEGLRAQAKMLESAKHIALFVAGLAYSTYEKGLRNEQELLGIISNMLIEIYASESALLRSLKMLHGKNPERATIPVKMTKVLSRDSTERIGFLAGEALEAIENGAPLEGHCAAIRRLAVSPPINAVALRRNIADEMIRYGRYPF